ncbi:unnamed protein product [Vitrella brassicaformis CCMP3155]|uniref:Uncharacterized protein n=1 Tax=Vitrella brassicaformis (strain CCMP3155) TaxID=1169540 RepID=A0A0G4GHA6_VITBC|nr:unnamed protein product [Vitrella brassicaformis CCMP3155]|eukprot:CEM29084.1 unnamed protein product [Vitrella brassicaformis CCMP3155]
MVDRVRPMDTSSHDAPAPSRGGRGNGSLRDVVGEIQSHNLALSNELAQTPTYHDKRRMEVDVEAGSAVGPNETDDNKEHSEAVSADDGAAKRRRVDISAAAGGHSGATQQQQEGVSSLSADLTAPMQHSSHQQQQQQHPVWYVCVPPAASPASRRSFFLLQIDDIVRLRATCKWVPLVRFDDDHFGVCDLLAAVCVMEEGEWVEIGEVIELAGQCRYCTLPVILTADDINTHANKTAYASFPRVLAQLMVVGRHVDFGENGSCLRIVRHGNGEVRAIKDEPGFRLDFNPPLPPGNLYQQHRQQHDPPVVSRIYYSGGTSRWVSGSFPIPYASVSSFAKKMIFFHSNATRQTNGTSTYLNRYVGGGRLDGLLTQSPHTPVAGCSTTLSWSLLGSKQRVLVLTDSSHPFVALIHIGEILMGYNDDVDVFVVTTEPPAAGVSEDAPFKDRFPVTTGLARVVPLGPGVALAFDEQAHRYDPSADEDDGDGDGIDESDDMDESDDVEEEGGGVRSGFDDSDDDEGDADDMDDGSGGEGASAEEEHEDGAEGAASPE